MKKELSNNQVQELTKIQPQRKEPMIKLLIERGWLTEKARNRILEQAEPGGEIL